MKKTVVTHAFSAIYRGGLHDSVGTHFVATEPANQLGKLRSRYLILKYGSLYEAVHSMDSSGIGGVPLTMAGNWWKHGSIPWDFLNCHKRFHFRENNTSQQNAAFWSRYAKFGRSNRQNCQSTLRVGTRLSKCFWLFLRSFFLIIRQPLVSRLPGFVSKQDFVQRLLSDRYCLSEFEAGRFKPWSKCSDSFFVHVFPSITPRNGWNNIQTKGYCVSMPKTHMN